jgi:hypothetical protein
MSVDNNAIVFVGVKEGDLDTSKLDAFDDSEFHRDGYYLNEWARDKGFQTAYESYSEYHPSVVGIQVADSGSYGFLEVNDLNDKIKTAKDEFRKEMNQEPEIFLFNYQW